MHGYAHHLIEVPSYGNGGCGSDVFRLCDGSAKKPVYAVVPSYHITPENEAIVSAPYGSILELQNVLVRYNPKHDAYNVLVSRNTGIKEVEDR